MTQYDTIEVEIKGHTACVTLNRPEVLNAINDEMIAELAVAYAEIERSQDLVAQRDTHATFVGLPEPVVLSGEA